MAVTYEQFLNALNGSKWKNEWSASDLELAKKHPEFGMTVLSYKEDWHNASTPEQRAVANEGAEYARKTWGNYTGGGDGSGYYSLGPRHQAADDALEKLGTAAPYRYSREGEYQSALTGAVRPEPFRYDPETDPVYASYRKTYTREGRRAGEDTLGQYSALTGGRPSSAAVTASQQAGNYYAAKLADKVPELYRDAYDRYLQEGEQDRQALAALRADRSDARAAWQADYDRLLQLLSLRQGQEQTEYDRGYRLSRDALADARYADETAYARSRDAVADTRYADETAYQRDRDALSDARYADETAYRRGRDAVADARYADETAYARGAAAGQRAYDRAREQTAAERQAEKDAYDRLMDAARLGLQFGSTELADALVRSGLRSGDPAALGGARPLDRSVWLELRDAYPELAPFRYGSYEDYLRDWRQYLAETGR